MNWHSAVRSGFLLVSLLTLTARAALLTEGFETVTPVGWVQTNNSSPAGTTSWFQGNSGIFPAQAGAADSYVAANFNNANFGGDVSNWLLTPTLALDPSVALSFFTRTEVDAFPGDHLEVRLSTNGSSTNVGATTSSVGDFTTLLLAINPTGDAYPAAWTQFTLSLSGVIGGPVSGRFAFRYIITDTSASGDYIGIDTVQVASVPEPDGWPLALMGLLSITAWGLTKGSMTNSRGVRAGAE